MNDDTQTDRDDISDASSTYGDRDQGFSDRAGSNYDGQRGRGQPIDRSSGSARLGGKGGARAPSGNREGGKPESAKDQLIKKPWRKLDLGGYLDAIADAGKKTNNVWLHQAFTAFTQGIINFVRAVAEFGKGVLSVGPKKYMERRERKKQEKEGVRAGSPERYAAQNVAPAMQPGVVPQVPVAAYYGPPPGGPGAPPLAGHGLGPAAQGMSDGVSGGHAPAPAQAQQQQQQHHPFTGFYAPDHRQQTVHEKRASVDGGLPSSRRQTIDEKRGAGAVRLENKGKKEEKKDDKAASVHDGADLNKKSDRETGKNPGEKSIKDIATGKKKVGEKAKGKPDVQKKPPLSATVQGPMGTLTDPKIKSRFSQQSASEKEKPKKPTTLSPEQKEKPKKSTTLSSEQQGLARDFGKNMGNALTRINGKPSIEYNSRPPSGPGCTPPRSQMPERAQQAGMAF
ncbi:MAG: hypothetical protein ABW189_03085 [Rickettsiales bacterium]